MRKTRIKMAVWMFVGMLVWSLPQVQVHAKAEDGGTVSLPHIHSGEDGACYHHHKDECYTVPVTCNGSVTRTQVGICGKLKKWEGTDERGFDYVYALCEGCGQFWDHRGDDIGDYHYHYDNVCNICGTRYDNACKKCSKVVKYDAGCGMDQHVLDCEYISCGTYRIICNDMTIAKETSLTCEVLSAEAGCHVTGYTWSNGDSAPTITVAENGTYTCSITYTDDCSGESGSAEVSITVNNIDNQGPNISANQTPAEWTKEAVLLTATAEDDQSGLHESAYSWNGSEWLLTAERSVTENGSYALKVRDRLGNQSEYVFTVSNIDHEPPVIEGWSVSTEEYTDQPITLAITAVDHGSGLADQAYSLDGEHWQSECSFMINHNGDYNVYVKDRLGNRTSLADREGMLTISNIRKTEKGTPVTPTTDPEPERETPVTPTSAPEQLAQHDTGASIVELTLEPEPLAQHDAGALIVELTLEISQGEWPDGKNRILVTAYGTESGLAQEPYSYDCGMTWTDVAEYEITESGVYVVFVRDMAGNITESVIEAVKAVSVTETEEVTVIPAPVFLAPQIDDPENQNHQLYQRQSSIGTEKIAAATGAAAGGGIFILFILYFGTWIPVYTQTATGEYRRIGRVRLCRIKEVYQIRLGRARLNSLSRSETNVFKLKFKKYFAKKHRSELLRIVMLDAMECDRRIDDEVTFQI